LIRAIAPSSASAGGGGGEAGSVRHRHHELRVESAQPHVDRARCQLPRDLVHRGGQGVEEGQAGGGLQRCDEPLGQGAGVVAAGVRGDGQLLPEGVDVGREVHDAIMALEWRHGEPNWLQLGVNCSELRFLARIGVP
jgi:hypothetical protein